MKTAFVYLTLCNKEASTLQWGMLKVSQSSTCKSCGCPQVSFEKQAIGRTGWGPVVNPYLGVSTNRGPGHPHSCIDPEKTIGQWRPGCWRKSRPAQRSEIAHEGTGLKAASAAEHLVWALTALLGCQFKLK